MRAQDIFVCSMIVGHRSLQKNAGIFVLKTICSLEHSFPGPFVLETESYAENSFP